MAASSAVSSSWDAVLNSNLIGAYTVATLALRRRMRAVWLSERDRVQLVEEALLTDEPWVLVYGISNTPCQFWDIAHARQALGYEPQDAAPALIEDEDEAAVSGPAG